MRWMAGVALAALALPGPAAAATEDSEVWLGFWANGKIDGKLLGSLDTSTRFSDRPGEASVNLVRGFVGYQVTPKLSLWAGYAHSETRIDGRPVSIESRPTAQMIWVPGKVGPATVTLRTRIEARSFSGRQDTGWRIRQSVRFVAPLGGKRDPSLVLQSENFFHLNRTDWGATPGFDQTRNQIGLNQPIGKQLQIEGGYLFRYVRRSGQPDRIDHVVPVTLVWRF